MSFFFSIPLFQLAATSKVPLSIRPTPQWPILPTSIDDNNSKCITTNDDSRAATNLSHYSVVSFSLPRVVSPDRDFDPRRSSWIGEVLFWRVGLFVQQGLSQQEAEERTIVAFERFQSPNAGGGQQDDEATARAQLMARELKEMARELKEARETIQNNTIVELRLMIANAALAFCMMVKVDVKAGFGLLVIQCTLFYGRSIFDDRDPIATHIIVLLFLSAFVFGFLLPDPSVTKKSY